MKFIFNIFMFVMSSALVVNAQSKSEGAPYSAKYDQMKDGINHILRMLEEQRVRIESLEGDGQDAASIALMNDELNETVSKLAELEEANKIESRQVFDRLSELENIVGGLPQAAIGEVILNSGGQAKVILIGDLGALKAKLPSVEDCEDFGGVLDDTFLRTYSSLFVLKSDGEVTMCKFLLGNWEIKDSSKREPGHVVVRVD